MEENREKATLKIGELAGRLGLNVRTLRYYESIGLLPEPDRTWSGYRLYSEEHEQLLRFVLQARQAGFSLDEIRRITRLARRGSPCDYVRRAASEHIASIDAQIISLQGLRFRLQKLADLTENAPTGPERSADGQICTLIERLSSSTTSTTPDGEIMTAQRKIEVFVAGCPLCEPVVKLVQRLACSSCEVQVYDLREGCATGECRDLARSYGVHRVPAVVIDGKLADCCQSGPVNETTLRAAGLGSSR